MKTKTSIIALFAALLSFASTAFAAGEGWVNNLEEALAKGKTENKLVMAEFTGSDWCPPCIMMNKKVFSKKEFVSSASPNFVLAFVDSPRKNKTVAKANQKFFEKHKIQGVPTIIIFNPDGSEKERFIASEYPSMEQFVAKLDKVAAK